MRIPRWKQWLSHLVELHVESRESDFNPHLYVSINKGRYQLSSANAIYSFGDMYTNFARVFARWDWANHAPQEVLLLGLGLGSIPVILEQTHARRCRYTAVEIDEEVADLAWQYVLHELESPVEMITSDASTAVYFLEEGLYDLICVDVFDDDTVPESIEDPDFLEQTKLLLSPDGTLLFNRLSATEADRAASQAFFEEVFLTVFPHGECVDVGGNLMLVSRPGVIAAA
jgi:hypothetical protein